MKTNNYFSTNGFETNVDSLTLAGAKRLATKNLTWNYDMALFYNGQIFERKFWQNPSGSFGWDKWQIVK